MVTLETLARDIRTRLEASSVRPAGTPATGRGFAVSLHVHSRPFAIGAVYDVARGSSRNVTTGHTSERGICTDGHGPGRALAAVLACECTLSPAAQARHRGEAP